MAEEKERERDGGSRGGGLAECLNLQQEKKKHRENKWEKRGLTGEGLLIVLPHGNKVP